MDKAAKESLAPDQQEAEIPRAEHAAPRGEDISVGPAPAAASGAGSLEIDGTVKPPPTLPLSERSEDARPTSVNTGGELMSEPSTVDLARPVSEDLEPASAPSSDESNRVMNEDLLPASSDVDDSLEGRGHNAVPASSDAVNSETENAAHPQIATASFVEHNTLAVASDIREDDERIAKQTANVGHDAGQAEPIASEATRNDVEDNEVGNSSVLDDIYSLTGGDDDAENNTEQSNAEVGSTVETKASDLDVVDDPEAPASSSGISASDARTILTDEEDDVIANETLKVGPGDADHEVSHPETSAETMISGWQLATPATQHGHEGSEEISKTDEIKAHREAVVVPGDNSAEAHTLSTYGGEHASTPALLNDSAAEDDGLLSSAEASIPHVQEDSTAADIDQRDEMPSKFPVTPGAISAAEDDAILISETPVVQKHDLSSVDEAEKSADHAAEDKNSIAEHAVFEPQLRHLYAANEETAPSTVLPAHENTASESTPLTANIFPAEVDGVEPKPHGADVGPDREAKQLSESAVDEVPVVDAEDRGAEAATTVEGHVGKGDEREAEEASPVDNGTESHEIADLKSVGPLLHNDQSATSSLTELVLEDATVRALPVAHEGLMLEFAHDLDVKDGKDGVELVEEKVEGNDHTASSLPELALEDATIQALPVAHEGLMPEFAHGLDVKDGKDGVESVEGNDQAASSLPKLALEDAKVRALPVAHEVSVPELANDVDCKDAKEGVVSFEAVEAETETPGSESDHSASTLPELALEDATVRALPVAHEGSMSELALDVADKDAQEVPTHKKLETATDDDAGCTGTDKTKPATLASESDHAVTLLPELAIEDAAIRSLPVAHEALEPELAHDVTPELPSSASSEAVGDKVESVEPSDAKTEAPAAEGEDVATSLPELAMEDAAIRALPVAHETLMPEAAHDVAHQSPVAEEGPAVPEAKLETFIDATPTDSVNKPLPAADVGDQHEAPALTVAAGEDADADSESELAEEAEIPTVRAESISPPVVEVRPITPVQEEEKMTQEIETAAQETEKGVPEAEVETEAHAVSPVEAPATEDVQSKSSNVQELGSESVTQEAAVVNEEAREIPEAKAQPAMEVPALEFVPAVPDAKAELPSNNEDETVRQIETPAPDTEGEAAVDIAATETDKLAPVTPVLSAEDIHPTPPMTPPQRRSSFSQNRLSKSFQRLVSIASTPSASPLSRTAADGSVLPVSAITTPVHRTNPILEELLYSLNLVADNDETLTELDLNDCPVFTSRHASTLASALLTNDKLKSLSLRSVALPTHCAEEIAEALIRNTTLEVLDLSNNSIAPAGIKALAEMLERNATLKELRLANQRAPAGTDAEQALARAMSKNEKLTTLRLQIRDVSSRNAIDRCITRNKEIGKKRIYFFAGFPRTLLVKFVEVTSETNTLVPE
ncbi:hypothetical protein HDU86_000197 [Geranomyces michiganensis]|nr:hypothetical protein HDU86_000197 [Geranomyces michiganensis]